jgi:hypothetical protein
MLHVPKLGGPIFDFRERFLAADRFQVVFDDRDGLGIAHSRRGLGGLRRRENCSARQHLWSAGLDGGRGAR